MEHILIVDDDQTFSSILGRALERRGYGVIISSTIEGALKSFKKYKPSKTVLDLKLKKGSWAKMYKAKNAILGGP